MAELEKGGGKLNTHIRNRDRVAEVFWITERREIDGVS